MSSNIPHTAPSLNGIDQGKDTQDSTSSSNTAESIRKRTKEKANGKISIADLTTEVSADVDRVKSTPFVGPVKAKIVLVPDSEEAYDLWLFRYNKKADAWHFSGVYQNGIFERLNQQGYHKRYSQDGNSLFFLIDESSLISKVIPARMRDSINAYVDGNTSDVGPDNQSVTYPEYFGVN